MENLNLLLDGLRARLGPGWEAVPGPGPGPGPALMNRRAFPSRVRLRPFRDDRVALVAGDRLRVYPPDVSAGTLAAGLRDMIGPPPVPDPLPARWPAWEREREWELDPRRRPDDEPC
jgi:hypothetical protein